jgi:hypothetical protein
MSNHIADARKMLSPRVPQAVDSLDGIVGPCFVRMFKPQFAPLVEAGTKLQTVRPTPKRVPQAGDRISLRAWTGKPYRSKQRVLRDATISSVERVKIDVQTLEIDGERMGCVECDEFAIADGFKCFPEMLAWFEDTHGLPFEGVIIHWSNVPRQLQPKKGDENKTDDPRLLAGRDGSDYFSWIKKNHPEILDKNGKLKMRINQNSHVLLSPLGGHPVRLTPDNWRSLVGESAEVEFYQGEVESPDIVRQIWDVAENACHPSPLTESER